MLQDLAFVLDTPWRTNGPSESTYSGIILDSSINARKSDRRRDYSTFGCKMALDSGKRDGNPSTCVDRLDLQGASTTIVASHQASSLERLWRIAHGVFDIYQ